MTDMKIEPKSDQLNADDLWNGPRTVTITKVSACSSADQPIAVGYEGDDGRPYKPCKSMRRVMVALWGPDAAQYTGRSMTLYRDPDVTWGGMKVGGIRISHMSHIEREATMALTATKQSRKPFTVKPLQSPPPAKPPAESASAPSEPVAEPAAGKREWTKETLRERGEYIAAQLRDHDNEESNLDDSWALNKPEIDSMPAGTRKKLQDVLEAERKTIRSKQSADDHHDEFQRIAGDEFQREASDERQGEMLDR